MLPTSTMPEEQTAEAQITEAQITEEAQSAAEAQITVEDKTAEDKIVMEGRSLRGVRPTNQDRMFFQTFADGRGALLAIADGMGGYQGGETASQLVIEHLDRVLDAIADTHTLEAARAALLRLCQEIPFQLGAIAQQNSQWQSMGTTFVCVCVLERRYLVIHLGDSRAYLVRGNALHPLTTDHNVGEDYRRGYRAEIGGSDPYWLTRALRVGTVPDPEILPADSAYPELKRGDALLLMSDGLHGSVVPNEMVTLLRTAPSLDAAMEALAQAAVKNGSKDNITVAALSLGAWQRQTPALPQKRTNPKPVAIAATLLALLGSGLVLGNYQGHRPNRDRQQEVNPVPTTGTDTSEITRVSGKRALIESSTITANDPALKPSPNQKRPAGSPPAHSKRNGKVGPGIRRTIRRLIPPPALPTQTTTLQTTTPSTTTPSTQTLPPQKASKPTGQRPLPGETE